MDDLSLFIQDIIENSINAKANHIQLFIDENIKKNELVVEIIDDGCGMSEETLKKVLNPFYTTRKTRNVGLGLSFFRESVMQTGGHFTITSSLGEGTKVKAVYVLNHIDTPPLGKIEDTIVAILSDQRVTHFVYTHQFEQEKFELNSDDLLKVLEIECFNDPQILVLIKNYVVDLLKNIRGGTK